MSIKTKISLALAFLFTVIVGLVLIGSYYLNQLARDAQEIIKDNYRTLAYVNHMTSALSYWQAAYLPANDTLLVAETGANAQAIEQFRENLELQLNNVTETGEREMNRQLWEYFTQLETLPRDTLPTDVYAMKGLSLVRQLNGTLSSLYGLNEESILHKNKVAQITANRVITYMTVIGGVCVFIGLAFLLGVPGYIANPIRELTHSIEQIAQHNYEQRLDFSSSDEFGVLARSFNAMAEKLSEYENSNLAQVLYEKKRTETVIRNMREAIVGLDEQKKILFANPTAQRLLNLSELELIGKYAPDIASINDLMRHLIRELMEDRKSTKESPLKIVEDGKEQYYTKEILDVFSPESPDVRIGQVIILKNITTYKELDLAKTNFIATISHELKTPIASIKMSTKLLENGKVGPVNQAQQELIQSIEEDGDRLLRITKELLDLTQVETGNIHLKPTTVAPSAVVDYALDAVRLQAKQKQVKLVMQANGDLPLVHADLEKSAWVMVNLLSNAIRYSPEGHEVIISIYSDGSAVAFSVQDFGRGISPEYQERIFEKYFQTPNSEKTGSGLGLAISREFINGQGGELWVTSQLGEGSAFTFTLPKA